MFQKVDYLPEINKTTETIKPAKAAIIIATIIEIIIIKGIIPIPRNFSLSLINF